MKILIVNNMAPFVWGGAEELATHLQKNLLIAGHAAEILRIPFQWEPAMRIPTQMLMVRAFELWNVDHVIALKFPAYLIRHPKKTIWLLHQYRQAYDLFDSDKSNIPSCKVGLDLKDLIAQADHEAFSESQKIFTNSDVTRQRLLKYNGFDAKVLHPPVNDPELFKANESRGYIFAGGRVNRMKRQYLLLEALVKAHPCVKLVIGGPPDTPEDAGHIISTVERLGLTGRVKLDLRLLPRKVYAEYINNSAAVAYLPYDEDSLGYVAMEAAMASKAVLTTNDSGGILTLISHKRTGWVSQPSVSGLSEAMNAVFENPRQTKDYGENARISLERLNINWPQVLETLLQ